RSFTAASKALGLSSASPTPMLTTTLVIFGICMTFFNPSSFCRAGANSFLYCSSSLFISAHLRLSCLWRLSSYSQRALPFSQSLLRLVSWLQVLVLLSFPQASLRLDSWCCRL